MRDFPADEKRLLVIGYWLLRLMFIGYWLLVIES